MTIGSGEILKEREEEREKERLKERGRERGKERGWGGRRGTGFKVERGGG